MSKEIKNNNIEVEEAMVIEEVEEETESKGFWNKAVETVKTHWKPIVGALAIVGAGAVIVAKAMSGSEDEEIDDVTYITLNPVEGEVNDVVDAE